MHSVWIVIGVVGSTTIAFFAGNRLASARLTQSYRPTDRSKQLFLQDIEEGLSKNKAHHFLNLLQKGLLEFKTMNIFPGDPELFGYFEITSKENVSLGKTLEEEIEENPKDIGDDEMDMYFLQHFDDVGYAFKKGLLPIDYIYEHFGYYIVEVFENKAVGAYINWVRKKAEFADKYRHLEHLYKALLKYRQKIKADSKKEIEAGLLLLQQKIRGMSKLK